MDNSFPWEDLLDDIQDGKVMPVIGHELIGLPWAMSFALGAIVSPTDPAAATAIMPRVGAPRRMVNVLEGESLFNDATALVAYKVAVAAAVKRQRHRLPSPWWEQPAGR